MSRDKESQCGYPTRPSQIQTIAQMCLPVRPTRMNSTPFPHVEVEMELRDKTVCGKWSEGPRQESSVRARGFSVTLS